MNINFRGCNINEIPKGSFEYENAINLTSFDFSYNDLKELPWEMHAGNLPYLYGVELSYNQFSEFPWSPLDSQYLTVFAIRGQRDENGARCLSDWPEGIYQHRGLRGFYIGSNNLGKVEDTISTICYYLDISDNPEIIFDASDVCYAIQQGAYILIYDKTQDIRNCDILF
jgi:Leucine-rich repeat (LRR) protein